MELLRCEPGSDDEHAGGGSREPDRRCHDLDPDGDRLTYQLETAPPGMTISEATGLIAWSIPPDQQGTFHVKVVARDGRGGMASQEFDLTLTAAGPPKPAEA